MFLASYWSVLDLIASVSVGFVYQDLDTTFNNFEVLRRGAEFKRSHPSLSSKSKEDISICSVSILWTPSGSFLQLGDQTPQVFCFQVGNAIVVITLLASLPNLKQLGKQRISIVESKEKDTVSSNTEEATIRLVSEPGSSGSDASFVTEALLTHEGI
ncbi:hypothetical protein HID58_062719 [Brassica napus]|uniref:BnaCnng33140D protein n=3 Tax=Brassica TaxID=3705 RepID=A0A078J3H1_BRANA|nr:hypothetical protein HID58_062719 [Brassica napus]CAF1865730.1 unnamed protein product [Brassica napus]CDY58365.1 BnaCnng33140D [Brassica napus]VDD14386.1 unnamed protein product [Brassica oleracea]